MSSEKRTLRDYGLKSLYVPILGLTIVRRSHFMDVCGRMEWDRFGRLVYLLTTHYESRTVDAIDIMFIWRK